MPVAITIRNVPDEVRDEHARRAALAGQSLQEYLRMKLVADVEKPPLAEVVARARANAAAHGARIDAATILADLEADRR